MFSLNQKLIFYLRYGVQTKTNSFNQTKCYPRSLMKDLRDLERQGLAINKKAIKKHTIKSKNINHLPTILGNTVRGFRSLLCSDMVMFSAVLLLCLDEGGCVGGSLFILIVADCCLFCLFFSLIC